MRKIKKTICILVSFFLIGSLMMALPKTEKAKIKDENSSQISEDWQKWFSELIEVAYIIMKDRKFFKQTNNYENEVYMGIADLKRELKRYGYEIKDIAVFIHNHFKSTEFSDGDKKRYRDLKRCGFNGSFLLYCHRTKKTYPLEEKKKSE